MTLEELLQPNHSLFVTGKESVQDLWDRAKELLSPALTRPKASVRWDETRTGRWFMTYSEIQYWISDPKAEDVRLIDIAQSLSRVCRYGGHTQYHYCVAQHSLEVAKAAYQATGSLSDAFYGLMHDTTEAYVGDMVSPLKASQPEYREIEQKNWLAIAEAVNLHPDIPSIIHTADKRVCATEFRDLRHIDATWMPEPYTWTIKSASSRRARRRFLEAFELLHPHRRRP